jgi:hypothetical protein
MIEVLEVQEKDLDDFISWPVSLYADFPLYTPLLFKELRSQFSAQNPFFRHAEARYFLAKKNQQNVGRIVAIVNDRHNTVYHDKTGFFGFFECVNDVAAASALFDRAVTYLRAQGMKVMRGPMNFSTNEECGFLLEGYHSAPMLMTPYNPPYYNHLAEQYGMYKAKDLYAYLYEMQQELPEKVYRVAAFAEKRSVTVRHIDKNKFDKEMLVFKEVYNAAWEKNWGFIPLTDEELWYEPIGFLGMLPDFNIALRHMSGKLNPLTMLKGLYYTKKIKDVRLLLYGIKRTYRNKGVDALLFKEGFKGLKEGGYKKVEFSWILEDNRAVQRIIELMGGRLYKRYRIYEKQL